MEIKKGEFPAETILRRTNKGLQICVQVHQAVEEFFDTAGGGETVPVEVHGRKWLSVDPEIALIVYEVPLTLAGVRLATPKVAYRLDNPGCRMVTSDQMTGLKTLNMSFLRLVGASRPGGITFNVTDIHSEEEMIWLSTQIREAGKQIYSQFIKPMEITIRLVEDQPTTLMTLDTAMGGG